MSVYRNTKTGAVLETECVFSGDDWEQIDSEKKKPAPEQPKKAVGKGKAKK